MFHSRLNGYSPGYLDDLKISKLESFLKVYLYFCYGHVNNIICYSITTKNNGELGCKLMTSFSFQVYITRTDTSTATIIHIMSILL